MQTRLPLLLVSLGAGCGVEGIFTPVPVDGLEPAADVSLGAAHSCAVLANGNVGCWGDNGHGQLGVTLAEGALDTSRPTWLPLPASPVEVASGAHHGCALLEDGSVHCWGDGAAGQLGVEVACESELTCPTPPVRVPDVDGAIAIRAGGAPRHDASGQPVGDAVWSCALEAEGDVWCWGANDRGQLTADDGPGIHPRPVLVVDTDGFPVRGIVDLDLGSGHACAVDEAGDVWCWGSGEVGQAALLGGAARVEGVRGAVAIATGDRHSCALRVDGRVSCWGWNLNGQSGDTFASEYCESDSHADCLRTPTVVAGVADAIDVTAGERHSCALLGSGDVVCWGSNQAGQLGDGRGGLSSPPVRALTSKAAVAVDAGGAHTCAVLRGGAVECWGRNGSGQVGSVR